MDNEALGEDLEDHFKGEKDSEDLADAFQFLVPLEKVVAVIVIVDCEDDRVQENEQDDEIFENVRAGKVDELNAHRIFEMQAVERSVVVDKDFIGFFASSLRATSQKEVGLVDMKDALNEVRGRILPLILDDVLDLVPLLLFIDGALEH